MATIEESAHYHLGVDVPAGDVITLDTHPEALDLISNLDGFTSSYQENLGITEPFQHQDESWGYGGVAKVVGSQLVENWVSLRYDIPDISEQEEPDHEDLLALTTSMSLTMGVLNNMLAGREVHGEIRTLPTDPDRPQLLTVDLVTNRGAKMDSAPIYAKIKPPLIRWLDTHITDDLSTEVSQIMLNTYSRLTTNTSWLGRAPIRRELWEFPVALRTARDIHLDVPGNATGLDPSQTGNFGREGTDEEYRLIPHNVDRIPQQLGLMAGVVYLGQKALRES